MKRFLIAASIIGALLMFAAGVGAQVGTEVALRAAIEKETVKGDLNGAIADYKKVLTARNVSNKTAAETMYHLGVCYQKLGDAQARQTFEQLIARYSDQGEVVAQARARLAALNAGAGGVAKEKKLVCGDCGELGPMYASIGGIGKTLVVSTAPFMGDLVLRDLATGKTRNLVTANAKERVLFRPLISEDGNVVVYRVALEGDKWEIRSIHTDGTGTRTHLSGEYRHDGLTSNSFSFPVALSPDARTAILKSVQGPLQFQVLSLVDNSLKPFGNTPSTPSLREQVSFSPDGRRVVFTDAGGLFLANADGSGVRPLLKELGECMNLFWTAGGKWIVFDSDRIGGRSLWAIPPTGGEPRLLEKGFDDKNGAGIVGIDQDGSVYYGTVVAQTDVQTVKLDGGTLAITGQPSRLINTFLGRNYNPSFSPDGQWIAWESRREAISMVVRPAAISMVVRPAAGGEEKILWSGNGQPGAPTWFPDSKALLRCRFGPPGEAVYERVEVVDARAAEIYRASTKSSPEILTLAPDGKLRGGGLRRPSPDGKWLAMIGSALSGSGGLAIFLTPAVGGPPAELAKLADGETFSGPPVWTPDSRHLLYAVRIVDSSRQLRWDLRAVPADGGTPRTILESKEGSISGLTFHPDGRLAYAAESSHNELWVARNLLPPAPAQ